MKTVAQVDLLNGLAKLAQKDRGARWTVKYTKAKPREDGSLPAFGYSDRPSGAPKGEAE